ncbi:MAG: hypothetical protein IPK16_25335 [Anaerolineales bacterium]|nr:hypothetical protein [Anaerolineales bacterium]
MGPDVKPFTHWVIYRGYKVRFTERSPHRVAGILTLPDGGATSFQYDPATLTVTLPQEQIVINAYGWEIQRSQAK